MARQTRQFPQGKYVLRTPHDTKDGQVYAVYLYYFWKGKQIRKSVDLFTTQNPVALSMGWHQRVPVSWDI